MDLPGFPHSHYDDLPAPKDVDSAGGTDLAFPHDDVAHPRNALVGEIHKVRDSLAARFRL